MTATATIDHQSAKASPIDVLRERAEAKCLLIANGYQDLQSAVDELWIAAERDGLIDKFGADEIQQLLGEALGRWRS
jgi:hypothetical protein